MRCPVGRFMKVATMLLVITEISVRVAVEASEVFLETLQRFRKQYCSLDASISIGQVALWINEATAALCCSPTVESSP